MVSWGAIVLVCLWVGGGSGAVVGRGSGAVESVELECVGSDVWKRYSRGKKCNCIIFTILDKSKSLLLKTPPTWLSRNADHNY